MSLTKYKFTSNKSVRVQIQIEGEIIERSLPVLEGRMRIRIPAELTNKVIECLKEGQEVVILVDGFEQSLHSNQFSKLYEKLTSTSTFLQNPFKGFFNL